jgi:hypothetical protein
LHIWPEELQQLARRKEEQKDEKSKNEEDTLQ